MLDQHDKVTNCSKCGKLIRGIKISHPGIKGIVCKECFNEITKQTEGEATSECPQCKEKDAHIADLEAKLRTIHATFIKFGRVAHEKSERSE